MPPPVVVPVFVSAVPAADPIRLAVEPGTTVLPVPPGVLPFMAALPGVTVPGDATSPVFMPEAALLSAVPGDAVADRLLPWLPAGLFGWAMAVAIGAAIKPATSRIERAFETIFIPFQRRRRVVPENGARGGTRQAPFRLRIVRCSIASINQAECLPP